MYANYARDTYAVWKTKPLVWFLEGDFIQYTETSQGSPLTMAELGQLAADITCAIKSNMPNAVVAINHTTWNADEETNSFWCEMKRADYDLVWTTGVGNNGNFIESAGDGWLLQRRDRHLPVRPHADGQDHRRRHQLRRLGDERQLVEPDRGDAEQPHHERRHRRQHRQQPALELPDADPGLGTLSSDQRPAGSPSSQAARLRPSASSSAGRAGSSRRSITGSTASPSSVDERMPPMTTVASGRCTSAPACVEIAIGMKPTAATSAVVSTGRSTVHGAAAGSCSSASPPADSQAPRELAGHDDAVQHRDAGDGDEADRRRDRERQPAQAQRQHAAHQRERHARRTRRPRSAGRRTSGTACAKMTASAIGTTKPRRLLGAREVLELAAPLHASRPRAASPARATRVCAPR